MKHVLVYFLAFIALLVPGNIYAQRQGQYLIDSLQGELPKTGDDTNKVKLLHYISFVYSTINQEEGIRYGLKSLELAVKLNYKRGLTDIEKTLGSNYFNKTDYPNALACFQKAMEPDGQTGNKSDQASICGIIGIIYQSEADYANALNFYFKALKLNEETGDKQGLANVTENIGSLYLVQGDFSQSLIYFRKALKLNENAQNKNGIASSLGNIANVYVMQKDYAKALESYFLILKTSEDAGDKKEIAGISSNIGAAYSGQKNYPSALTYFLKALYNAEVTEDKYTVALNLCNIGETYIAIVTESDRKSSKSRQLLRDAIDSLQKGLAIAKEIHAVDEVQACYENLAKAYKMSGDYKNALDAGDNYRAIKDSVFSKENNNKIVQQGLKFDFDKIRLADSLKNQEKENIGKLRLQRQRSYTYIGAAGILLLAGFTFFVVRERGKSEKLLLNILPSEVAKELKQNGRTVARNFDEVTVLFTDFVSFTKVSIRLSPQELVNELDACFKAFDHIMGRYNIEKIKTVGDAYLAVCGLPKANPDHAKNVILAAIEIKEFMIKRKEQLGNKTFEVRIGIHSGSVVAGIVGVKKFAYDIWGDTVNTAARMEQNSEAGRINISETTYELVKDKFTCEYRGQIEAKNKGALTMYYVG